MFFFGEGLKPGLHGVHPSLTDLADGDIKPTADFRELYDACLGFLKIDPKPILGARFRGVTPFA